MRKPKARYKKSQKGSRDKFKELRQLKTPISNVVDQEGLKEVWHKNRSVAENRLNAGLLVDVNEQKRLVANLEKKIEIDPTLKPKPTIQLKKISKPEKQVNALGRSLAIYLTTLYKTFGLNFEKMARDTRLNYRQFTAAQLKNHFDEFRIAVEARTRSAEEFEELLRPDAGTKPIIPVPPKPQQKKKKKIDSI